MKIKAKRDIKSEIQTSSIYKEWMDCIRLVKIPALSFTTCCELIAILQYCAIEEFIFDEKLNADITYAQHRLKLVGGETPDPDDIKILKSYIREMEVATYDQDNNMQYPKWAVDIMQERYGITLPNYKI